MPGLETSYPYLIETHLHTSEVSSCGRTPAAQLAQLLAQKGYHGVVVTDHFYDGFFERASGSWSERVHAYFAGFRALRNAGAPLGLLVYPGFEMRFAQGDEDYLVYNVPESFLIAHPELYALPFPEAAALLRAHAPGCLIAQAHPCRRAQALAHPEFLDAVEVFNGHPWHESNNGCAKDLCARAGLIALSGTDCHDASHVGISGIRTARLPRTIGELCRIIRAGEFRLVDGGRA